MPLYKAEFYRKKDGSEPAKEFIISANLKMQAKIARTITALQENGPELREPYSKYLNDGIFELRAKVGSDITRVLYFFYVGKKIILTNGFTKKTDRTPVTEIEKAKKYRADYLSREVNKNDNI